MGDTMAARLGASRVLDPSHPPPEGARFILNLGIREADKERTLALLERNRHGKLTNEENDELDSYIQADNMLSILKAKALAALKQAGQEP
jgi:hypothetical protein